MVNISLHTLIETDDVGGGRGGGGGGGRRRGLVAGLVFVLLSEPDNVETETKEERKRKPSQQAANLSDLKGGRGRGGTEYSTNVHQLT